MRAIVSPAEMADIDAAAPEPVEELIERAGWAVARAAIDLLGGTYGRRVVVVAGKGNNGADGRAAARRLERRGVRVNVVNAAAPPDRLPPADLIIDAAYGTGFRGAYDAPAPASDDTPVLAVDIPSGISGDTGVASGRPSRAVRTVTFAALKPGLLLGAGPDFAGEVVVADIGLDVSGARAHLVEPADVAGWLPTRPRDAHKWQCAVRLVGGSPGMIGAVALAAGGALRGGSGYVRASVPGAGAPEGLPVEAVVTELPALGWAEALLGELDRFRAMAIGPGLGRGDRTTDEVMHAVRSTGVPTVVDGDGLRALGAAAAVVIGERPDGGSGVVLTPHDGEYEALRGGPPGPDRFGAARSMAAATGATVLLKGSTTLVASPTGEVLACDVGDARLATAGTGDVLTGLIAALLAQGLAPAKAAAAAAFLHGTAGALAWRRGLVASDLVALLPAAIARVAGG